MSNYKFETLQLHVGQEAPDPATDARAVPIYQTTSYVFRNSAHAAARFGLADAGNIYGRLTNSTQDVLEKRIAALEGGVAALALASGAAAITYAIQALAQAGDHIVAQKTIYGGSYNLLSHTLPQYGITTTFVNAHDLEELESAIQSNTKAVYLETLGNPNSDIPDIDAIAEVAHRHGLPLVVESVCKHVAILDDGAVVEQGEVTEVFSHPESTAARRLVFPEGDSDSLITGDAEQHFIRIVFNGARATASPLIAKMAVEKGIEASIAYASTRSIGGKAYGSMLLSIPGCDGAVQAAIGYLTQIPDVLAEEVTAHVS